MCNEKFNHFINVIFSVYNGFLNFGLFKKIVVVSLSSFISLCSELLLFQFVKIPMRYNEFIVGACSWGGCGKAVDVIAGPLFILVFIFSFGLLSYFLKLINFETNFLTVFKLKSNFKNLRIITIFVSLIISFLHMLNRGYFNNSNKIIYFFLLSFLLVFIFFYFDILCRNLKNYKYWFLPLIFVIMDYLFKREFSYIFFLPLYALIIGMISSIYFYRFKIKNDTNYVNYSMIVSIMLMFLPVSIFSVLYRFGIYFSASKIILVWCILVFTFNILIVTSYYGKFKFYFNKFLLCAQLFLPLLFFNIIPKKIYSSNLGEISYNYSNFLLLIVLFYIIIATFDIIKRYNKYNVVYQTNGRQIGFSHFSPFALFALLIILKFQLSTIPTISTDDYHFGESLLGTWSYMKGLIPYLDYLPAHGLFADDFSSFINCIIFDGFAGSFYQANIIASILTCLIVFLSINFYNKNIFLTFIVVLLVPCWFNFNWLILIPFFCLWLNHKLFSKPLLWISVFILSSPLLILLVPPQGCIAVASFLPIFLYVSYSAIKNKSTDYLKVLIFVFLLLAYLLIFTPYFNMLYSACMYVFDNSKINLSAYGRPLFYSWFNIPLSKIFIRELMRNFWVFIVIFFFITILMNLKDRDKFNKLKFLGFIIFILLMTPYAMGRIDPGETSRPFILSTFAIFLFPIFIRDFEKKVFVIFFAFYVSYFGFIPNMNMSHTIDFLLKEKLIAGEVVRGKDYGLENFGVVQIDKDHKDHFDRLWRINQLLKYYLSPKDSYLDLTNRNAHYFYLNRIPIISVTAPYNMVSIKQQMQAIKDIEKRGNKFALLYSRNIIHDGGGLALRNPLLFRYVYLNYIPFQYSDMIFGIKSDFTAFSNIQNLQIPNETLFQLQEISFSTKRLGNIPLSWGLSYDVLKNRLTNEVELNIGNTKLFDLKQKSNSFTVIGESPSLNYSVENYNISGLNLGMLVLNIDLLGANKPFGIKLSYSGDNQEIFFEENYLTFFAHSGILIIPLDTQPRWLAIKKIKNISIEFENLSFADSFVINSAHLYQRKIFVENKI